MMPVFKQLQAWESRAKKNRVIVVYGKILEMERLKVVQSQPASNSKAELRAAHLRVNRAVHNARERRRKFSPLVITGVIDEVVSLPYATSTMNTATNGLTFAATVWVMNNANSIAANPIVYGTAGLGGLAIAEAQKFGIKFHDRWQMRRLSRMEQPTIEQLADGLPINARLPTKAAPKSVERWLEQSNQSNQQSSPRSNAHEQIAVKINKIGGTTHEQIKKVYDVYEQRAMLDAQTKNLSKEFILTAITYLTCFITSLEVAHILSNINDGVAMSVGFVDEIYVWAIRNAKLRSQQR